MRKILIITGRYLPGYRDGGPVRTLVNLTEWLGDEYDFRIMCLDRDHGDASAYPGIAQDRYSTVGKAKVWYTRKFTPDVIAGLSREADVVYCCGPYSDYARMVMRLKKAGKFRAPLFVASMGSFSPEAFKIKGLKKRLFIRYMKLAGLFDNVTWSVTSDREKAELSGILGSDSKCIVATDLPRRGITEHTHIKEKGQLNVVFLSRITTKKNLIAIPGILRHTDDEIKIKLDIYGTPEDAAYLHECMSKLDEVKKTHPLFKWEYKGEADSEKVPEILSGYDAFLFPTLGENYGHVIAESISAGCIPIISDTTPWVGLDEKGCGFVCPLNEKEAFAGAVEKIAAMDEEELKICRDKCYEYITSVNKASVENTGYRKIFG